MPKRTSQKTIRRMHELKNKTRQTPTETRPLTDNEIAQILGVNPAIVKRHLRIARRKTQ